MTALTSSITSERRISSTMCCFHSTLLRATALSIASVWLAFPPAHADSLSLTAAEHTPFTCDKQFSVAELGALKIGKANRAYRIELSIPSLANPYIQAMVYGARKAAQEAGVTLSIDAGSGFLDPASQITKLENALSHHTDAVLINPADPAGLAAMIDDTVDNGTPVIDVGTLSASKASDKLVQDDYSQGLTAAHTLAILLPAGGEGIVMGGPANASWARRRVAGFEDGLKQFPKLKVAALTNQDVKPEEGLRNLTDAAQAHPGFSWIYATGSFLLPPKSVPQEYRRAVYIAGSLTKVTQEALLDGSLAASLPDYPIWVGYAGVALALQKLEGSSISAHNCIPNNAVLKAEAHDPVWVTGNITPANAAATH